MTSEQVYERLDEEMIGADRRYGAMTSTHEGLGVLTEEVAELVQAIRANRRDQIEAEAIQVAAVALRLVLSLEEPETRVRSGMGGP